MQVPEITVHWVGPASPPQPLNPVVMVVPPLVAGQLTLLAETEEFRIAAAEHPKAYAGVIELLTKVNAELDRAGRVTSGPSPKQAAEEGFHRTGKHWHADPTDADKVALLQFESPAVTRFDLQTPSSGIHQAIEKVTRSEPEPVRFVPGRARIPRSLGSLGVHLEGRGAVND